MCLELHGCTLPRGKLLTAVVCPTASSTVSIPNGEREGQKKTDERAGFSLNELRYTRCIDAKPTIDARPP
jgi:hypothetical protein